MHKNLIAKCPHIIHCNTLGTKSFGNASPVLPITPEFIFLNLVEVMQAYQHLSHQHSSYELIIPVKDHYKCVLNNVPMTLNRNELLIVQPNDQHQDILAAGTVYYALWFTVKKHPGQETLDHLFHHLLSATEQKVSYPYSALEPLLMMIEEEGTKEAPFTDTIVNSIFNILFWNIIRTIPECHLPEDLLFHSHRLSFQSKLWNYFSNHLDSNINLAEMARALNMSQSSLSHKCKEYLGMPPAKAFLHCKIEHAEYLLKQTDQPVKEVSTVLGFKNPFHFSKAFKRLTGYSPTKYREQA